MRYSKVHLESLAYELAPVVVSSRELEEQLAPAYRALRIQPGQLEAMTGIVERRYWERGDSVAAGATAAAVKALRRSRVDSRDLGALIYAGVCREGFEPATACDVAAELGRAGMPVSDAAVVHDLGNACLGVLDGILEIANRIELGQIRAGMVVSCESAREIVDLSIARMNDEPTMEVFRYAVATLTGGSGAIAVIVSDRELGGARRRLVGAVHRNDPAHHRLCRWGVERVDPVSASPGQAQPLHGPTHREFMRTDSVAVLEHGVELGRRTYAAFRAQFGWSTPDRSVCHQVGAGHRRAILQALELDPDHDFVAYDYLGNTGTVALPLAVAMAEEREFLCPGQRVALLGIGSGLNCTIMGVEW